MRYLIALMIALLMIACKSRESDLQSAIEPENKFESGVLASMTPIPNTEIDGSYYSAFVFNAEQAVAETASLAEEFNSELECQRQKRALMELFFLEIENPRGIVSIFFRRLRVWSLPPTHAVQRRLLALCSSLPPRFRACEACYHSSVVPWPYGFGLRPLSVTSPVCGRGSNAGCT